MTALAAAPPSQALKPARVATRAQFFCLGFAAGSWGVHIPSAKSHYGVSEGVLSLALLAAAIGSVACLLVAGKLVHQYGPRRIAVVAGLMYCAALAAVLTPGFEAPAFGVLVALMVVFGGATALFDVAINAEGTLLENLSHRKVMSGFHGMFSLGGMVAAGVGALLLSWEAPVAAQLAAACAFTAGLVVLAGAYMLVAHPQDDDSRSHYSRPRGTLLVLGLLGAVGLVAEGAIYDWSVLYMKQETGSAQSFAALGYASFSGAMAATRFGGDWLRTHIPAPRLMAASAATAAISMAVVLVAAHPLVALVGFAFVGAGFANVVPILFMAASRTPGVAPATAIAIVSSLGYLGFVAGPPLIGGIAHVTSLTWGLAVVVAGAALLAWGARKLPH